MKRTKLFLMGLMASTMFMTNCFAEDTGKGSEFAKAHIEATGLEASAEGYSEEGDGYTMEVAWCQEENADIFGRIFYPAEFDESQKYPTIVMCHGGGVTADIYSKVYAPYLAKEGYVCYVFDCRSATDKGRGSYSTELAEGEEVTVSTYAADLDAAMDFMESKEYTDRDHLYLFGQSMGGVTSEYVASKRSDEIAGMIVLYGSVDESNKDMMPEYETVKENPYSNGEVLFIQGTLDSLPYERTISNMEWYEHSAFIDISKAGHGFGNMRDRATDITCAAVDDFIERDLAGEEQEDLSPATEEMRAEKEEGYTIEGDGFYSVVTWFKNGDSDMFGRVYYPADYVEGEKYPTMVMCHGTSVNADIWDSVYAPRLAKEGYICFTYDCRSSGAGFRGSYSTPLESGDDTATVDDYVSDTNVALDFIQGKEFVDTEKIYLFGQSKGGMTAQVVASRRAEEIKGLVILYGTVLESMIDTVSDFDQVEENPYNQGETLMILGDKDNYFGAAETMENMSWYELSTFLYISDAAHGFGNHNTRPAQIAVDEMVNFVNRTLETSEE